MHSTESGKWLMLRVSLIEASWKEGLWGPEGNCRSIVRHRITLAEHYAGQRPTIPSLPFPLSLSLSLSLFLSRNLVVRFVHSLPMSERNSISRLARSQRLAPLTNNATLCAPVCSRIASGWPSTAPTPSATLRRCPLCSYSTRYSARINGNRRSSRVFFQSIDITADDRGWNDARRGWRTQGQDNR